MPYARSGSASLSRSPLCLPRRGDSRFRSRSRSVGEVALVSEHGLLNKVLALGGTILAWFPIAATVFFSITGSVSLGIFRFDYLMPAELSPIAFGGGVLLLWAALRNRRRRLIVGCSLIAMVVFLAGSQGFAILTGLASGETEAVGWRLVVAAAGIVLYALATVTLGVAGILLLGDLFRREAGGGSADP